MKKLMNRFWADDQGAVITTEFLLIASILLLGLVPAFVGFRNQLSASLLTIGNIIHSQVGGLKFDGLDVLGPDSTIASVDGYGQLSANTEYLTLGKVDAAAGGVIVAANVYVTPNP
ncbi:Flp family type IVb pilin [Tuwongella immobilis]|uniref:Uncharacterized protein n=1 Tax=Tuwongella immobilis TaxID=692036 RepID=A0A6C2YW15_9BACT|nr:hypothetical protein [Tuwongella immobilis]VIP05706.1 unnamed protein product [Tuwongella immobilis]VTS08768.1 unnamed protein product [Tuwongella immobilis]